MREVRAGISVVERGFVGGRGWPQRLLFQVLILVLGGLVLAILAAVIAQGPAGAQTAGFDWQQIGADIDGAAAGDESGDAVAVSADGARLVIGSPDSDTNGDDPGHVRVFDLVEGEWVQIGTDIAGAAGGDRFGDAVAISADGSTVVVGAPLNDTIGESVGQVRVFNLVEGQWVQIGIDLFGQALFDQFGDSVAVSADGAQVVVGAVLHDNRAGHVQVFELDAAANTWFQVGSDIDGEAAGDESGGSVAVSADGARLVIGASGNDNNGDASGHVRVFDLVNGEWVQVGTDLDGDGVQGEFGGAVAVSADGATVVAGASFNGGSAVFSGYVRAYALDDSGSWAQVGTDIDGEAVLDLFGGSLAVTADGSTVVAGADMNDGSGDDSGHVRVFDLVDGEWMQVGTDIDGEAAGDGSGVAVAVSADGARVVAGAAGNDANGDDAGHVRVYDLTVQSEQASTCADVGRDGQPRER